MAKSPAFRAHLALATVTIFYGVNYFTLKTVFMEGFSNFAVLALRCFFATIVFVVFHQLAIRERVASRKDLGRLALCALFGVSLNQIFFLWGLATTSRVNSAVLMVTAPIFVFVIAWVLRQEKITPRKLLGLALSFGGAVALILTSADASATSGANISGDLMIMFNACSYATYLVLVKPLAVKYNAFTIVKWIFLFGSVPNIAIGIVPLMNTDFSNISDASIFGLVFLILCATIGAYFLNAWAMKNVPSSSVGMYVYFQPVLVTTGSAIIGLGEVNWLKIQFILLIFAGVFLVTMTGNGVHKSPRIKRN